MRFPSAVGPQNVQRQYGSKGFPDVVPDNGRTGNIQLGPSVEAPQIHLIPRTCGINVGGLWGHGGGDLIIAPR